MQEQLWTIVVSDARGRDHRGTVAYTERLQASLQAPARPLEFQIVLLSLPQQVDPPPAATAVCVPEQTRLRSIGPRADSSRRRADAGLVLSAHESAAFSRGAIIMSPQGLVEPTSIFPSRGGAPHFEHLALALLEVARAEALAPYTALVRRELSLPANMDAMAALDMLLTPANKDAKPPSRAPSVIRLKRASARMRNGQAPTSTPDQFAEDLRFLRLFDERLPVALSRDALNRLLGDLLEVEQPRPLRRRPKIVPFPQPREES